MKICAWVGLWVLTLSACANVVSNLPDKMTDQIHNDWRCDEMHGSLVERAPGWETWDVVACGRAMRVSCPFGPHSRWRRCRYPEPEPVAPAALAAAPLAPESRPPEMGLVPPPPPPVTAGGAVEADAAELAARAALDARRAAIVACAEGHVVAVDLRWRADPSGAEALEVRLGGALANTPAEGCVRAALEGVTLAAPRSRALRHVLTP